MSITEGIYESIINITLEKRLAALDVSRIHLEMEPIDKAEASSLLSSYLSKMLQFALKEFKGENSLENQIDFCNRIITFVDKELELDLNDSMVSLEGKLLTGVLSKIAHSDSQLRQKFKRNFPVSGLSFSSLFTGASADIPIDSEIEKDILTADKVYWIVSFIRWSGLRLFENCLREFTSKPGKELRIITTTYMGVSEERALSFLSQLPNTQIKISYQTNVERLHAKSYIFERNTGFDTAYIGSSNLSRSALTSGLEWNIRVTSRENPHIMEKAKATFEHYWNSIDFEDFRIGGITRFKQAMQIERSNQRSRNESQLVSFSPFPFQKVILDQLKVEREIHNRSRNLIVAATGTGKTVISAFDFKRFFDSNKHKAKLLFVAHRKEILVQSCRTFRNVLSIRDFGELWVGGSTPESHDHLFVSVQTFNLKKNFFKERFPRDYYDFIIIDEAHHSQANSYRDLFEIFEPKILLGLTATPERMDGQSLLPDFCNKIAAEIRLPDALSLRLLSPFHYFCITDDSVDLRSLKWSSGKYDVQELSKVLSVRSRSELIVKAIFHYLTDPYECKALCFCSSKEHAVFMSEELNKSGLKATYLVSGGNADNEQERRTIHQNLKMGKVNYVCVVDIFNEGVDIPEVDTVLFLRPTESLTVFLQQLGRGLRLSESKDCLTVLDFVSQAHVNYNYSQRFRALVGKSDTNIENEIQKGFPGLPAGCSIKMEKQAKEYIIKNIQNAVFNLVRLTNEIATFHHHSTLPLTLKNFLEVNQLDIRTIYKNGHTWNSLKTAALKTEVSKKFHFEQLNKGLKRLIHIDSPRYLHFISELLQNDFYVSNRSEESYRLSLVFYFDMWQKGVGEFGFSNIYEGIKEIANYPVVKQEIQEIHEFLWENINHSTKEINLGFLNILELHARYSRDQILASFAKSRPEKPFPSQEGVVALTDVNAELMLVTLNKSDKEFSPTTQYEDYAISETIFHWQSQNKIGPDSPTGLSYINHRKKGKTLLLFVRESKSDSFGFTMPYHFLGPVSYITHKGERPMSINWQLNEPMPPSLFKSAAKMATG